METYFIEIRIETIFGDKVFKHLDNRGKVKEYVSIPAALKELKKAQDMVNSYQYLKGHNEVSLCKGDIRLVPITEEDLGELDAIQLDELYSPFLTKEDKKKLRVAFKGESIDDEDFVNLQYSVIYDRLSDLGLLK